MTIEFQAWPKIARLNRNIVITEKIDGTNAAIGILSAAQQADLGIWTPGADVEPVPLVYAQSRTRIITPEKDNFGFARWVADNADVLRETLGPGLHFGEWWGPGIQRGYGVASKRFSLFRSAVYAEAVAELGSLTINVVPVLYEGPFDETVIGEVLLELGEHGSYAAPGFMKPEGIVIYHAAAGTMFKVTLEGDAQPKGQAA